MKTDKRKYSRVNLTLLVKITFFDNPNKIFLGKDISLSGMFVATHLNIKNGMRCLVELDYNHPNEFINREILSKVVRRSDGGFGVQFLRMDYETHMMLQTRLLYSCSDPSILCEEFSGNSPVMIMDKSGSSNLSALNHNN
jgi:hypothetical protein